MDPFWYPIINYIIKHSNDSATVALVILNIILTIYFYRKTETARKNSYDEVCDMLVKILSNGNETSLIMTSHIKETEDSEKLLNDIKSEVLKTGAVISILSIQNGRSLK